MRTTVDRQKLDEIIEYLQEHKTVECDPYPVYSAEIMAAFDLLKPDRRYLAHYEKLGRKPIAEMDADDIATMLTFIVRGERFSDGHIASFVESGELLELMLRLREL